jgi:hypothetical protein
VIFLGLNKTIIVSNQNLNGNFYGRFLGVSAAKQLNFNKTAAYNHIVTQLDFGPRVPGTVSHDDCASWISSELNQVTDSVVTHNFTIQKSGEPSYQCQNILGKINTQKENIVILSAHWDSRNVAEKDTINQSLPIPGANDGGSGVGVLLELARVLYDFKEWLDCQLWLLFLDAEDQGYSRGMYGLQGWNWAEGSVFFANEIESFYDNSTEDFDCFILLDMVGGSNLQFIKEGRSDDALHDSIFDEGTRLGYYEAFPSQPEIMYVLDDHVAFYDIGIPVVDLIIDFIQGEWTYHHTHADDLSNIDIESLMITGQTLESFMKKYYTTSNTKDWRKADLPTSAYLIITVGSIFFIGLILNSIRSKKQN